MRHLRTRGSSGGMLLAVACVLTLANSAQAQPPPTPDEEKCAAGDRAACCRAVDGPLGSTLTGSTSKHTTPAVEVLVDLRNGRKSAPTIVANKSAKTIALTVVDEPNVPVLLVVANKAGKPSRGNLLRAKTSTANRARFSFPRQQGAAGAVYAKSVCKGKLRGVDVDFASRSMPVPPMSPSAAKKDGGNLARLIARGEALYKATACIACHSLTGERRIGPTFKGLFGSTVDLDNGNTVVADAAYLRRAIRDPSKDVRKGYPPAMPRNQLSDDDIDALVAFIEGHR